MKKRSDAPAREPGGKRLLLNIAVWLGMFFLSWGALALLAKLLGLFANRGMGLYVFLAAFLLCMLGAGGLLLTTKLWGRTKTELQYELDESKRYMQEVQLQKRQEQLRALQNQINPHFLYNSLDAIRGMAIEQGNLEVSDSVATLSSMFKYAMDFHNSLVSVTSEVSQIERYLNMQSIRFPGRYTFEQVYECEYSDLNEFTLPKFTLQPLVENAVVHGLRNTTSGGKVTLRFFKTQSEFCIVVSDNGEGIAEEYVVAMNRIFSGADSSGADGQRDFGGNGIALPNVDARIKFYYGDGYGLYLASARGIGTDVEVRIPLPERQS